MSQHGPETCNESSGLWLPITEYSVKSGISLSTIRRKIKRNSIPFRLENGKYLILFTDGVSSLPVGRAPMSHPGLEEEKARRPLQPVKLATKTVQAKNQTNTLPLVEKSVAMVSDAFEHALKEKDKRIKLLEKRNSDLQERLDELRLLVQVLEEKYSVRY